MTIAPQASALLSQVETRAERLAALHSTVLRCIGALRGNTDSASCLVCEALQQVADELVEMISNSTMHNVNPSMSRRRDIAERYIDPEAQ